MDSYLQKFKGVAGKVGTQATAFAQQTGQQFNQQAKLAQEGFTLPKECEKAARILQYFLADPNHPDSALNSIPKAVLQQAKGIAVFSVVKAGFLWSGKAGSGVVTARLQDGSWSAPSCIATGGVGFGLQIGADLSEFVVILNSEEAVKSFSSAGNLQIGGSLSCTAGPVGTGGAIQAAISHPAPMFSYSRSKGFYAGLSLEGTVLVERKDANRDFYGQPIPVRDLLEGKVPAPEIASPMYEVLEEALEVDESNVPQQSYIPSQTPGGKGEPVTPYNLSAQGEKDGQAQQSAASGNAASSDSTASSGANTGSKPLFDAGGAH